ncbi:hypothetical protein SNEBB_010701 [Seison nebaliae]|nr:hypothetical protein SNEBB_010701 [Seison nebaliae]
MEKLLSNNTFFQFLDSIFPSFKEINESLSISDDLLAQAKAKLIQEKMKTPVKVDYSGKLVNGSVMIENYGNLMDAWNSGHSYWKYVKKHRSETGSDHAMMICITLLYICICIGIIGNLFVLFVIRNPCKKVTFVFISNMAVSDLLLLICSTPTVYVLQTNAINGWPFGVYACKTRTFLSYVTVEVTCLTLAAMTVDRFLAVVKYYSSAKIRTPKNAIIICATIWITSAILYTPHWIFSDLVQFSTRIEEVSIRPKWNENLKNDSIVDGREGKLMKSIMMDNRMINISHTTTSCEMQLTAKKWSKLSILYLITLSYILPLIVITISYVKIILYLRKVNNALVDHMNNFFKKALIRRQHITRLVTTITLVFATCWSPSHIINIWYICFPESFPQRSEVLYVIKYYAYLLSLCTSAINPFLYAFIHDAFQDRMKRLYEAIATCPLCQCLNGFNGKSQQSHYSKRLNSQRYKNKKLKKSPINHQTNLLNNGNSNSLNTNNYRCSVNSLRKPTLIVSSQTKRKMLKSKNQKRSRLSYRNSLAQIPLYATISLQLKNKDKVSGKRPLEILSTTNVDA